MMSERKMALIFLGLLAASMLAAAAPIEARDAATAEPNVYSDIRRGRRAMGDIVGGTLVQREVLKRTVIVGGHEGAVGGKARAGPLIVQPLGEDDIAPPPPPTTPQARIATPVGIAHLKLEPASYSGGIRLTRTALVIPDSQPFPAVKSTPVGLVGLANGNGVYSGKSVFTGETLDDTIAGLRLHIGTVTTGARDNSPQVGGDERKDPRSIGNERPKDVKGKTFGAA